MRLIDADKLYLPPEDMRSRMAVAYAPTAYDVDKVVEEIQEVAYCDYDEEYHDNGYCMVDMDTAIKIVKRGGVNEVFNKQMLQEVLL